MPICVVKACPHKSGQKHIYPDVVLHPFPNDLSRIKIWLQQTGDHYRDLEEFAQRVLKGVKTSAYRMCSKHFTPDMYMMKCTLRVLKPTAIPTVFPQSTLRSSALHQIHVQPPSKRQRIDDEVLPLPRSMVAESAGCISSGTSAEAHTGSSSMIVRIISRLAHKETQYDPRIVSRNVSVNTDRRLISKNMATDTDDLYKMVDKQTQTVDDPMEEEFRRAHLDHGYPVHFSMPERPRTSQKEVPGNPADNPVRPIAGTITRCEQVTGRSSYYPMEPSATSSDNKDGDSVRTQKDPVLTNKYIIFEDCLLDLLGLVRCQHHINPPCTEPIVHVNKSTEGAMLAIELTCRGGHKALKWTSCPTTSTVAVVNIMISSAILLSGSSFMNVNEMTKILSLASISEAMHFQYQHSYLFPSIDYHWEKEQEFLRSEIHGKPVVLTGDGQTDSLGPSTKACVYSMMDVMTKKIVTYDVEQGSEKTSSLAMEKIAFQKCLRNLLSNNVDVKIVATNRNSRLKRLMASQYPEIKHEIDVRHLVKSISKQLMAASRKSKCPDIAYWIDTITNHLCWCARSCKGDKDVIVAKWKSILFHIANKHNFKCLKRYTRCKHQELPWSDQLHTPWIQSSHKAHDVLCKIICDAALLKDIARIGYSSHTGGLENFRSKYKSVCLSMGMDGLHARTKLAILSHNLNVHRDQPVGICGSAVTGGVGKANNKTVFTNYRKQWVEKATDGPDIDGPVLDIIRDAISIMSGDLHHTWISSTVPMAGIPPTPRIASAP
ncbi:hypothetical protein GDO86_019268 [Hymenochirus boettgeri]|uniref:THAP-type domain-containing protein n=1 Tax=Hymenochirus boettgeri TaxID=247094 RepID=A0A8T2IH56_9PIPI|nr:hypothetical protein GDO86_019268 [Hymenochirus boettgeri]